MAFGRQREETLNRYEALVRLAADRNAAPNERSIAAKRIRKMDAGDPQLRVDYSRRLSERESEHAEKLGRGKPTSQSSQGGKSTSQSTSQSPEPEKRYGGLYDQLVGLFGARASKLAQAATDELFGAAVLAVDEVLREAEAVVEDVRSGAWLENAPEDDDSEDDSEDDDTEEIEVEHGDIDWTRRVRKAEHLERELANETISIGFDVLEDDDDVLPAEAIDADHAGSYVEVSIVLPFDLFERLLTSPELCRELLASAIDSSDDDDD